MAEAKKIIQILFEGNNISVPQKRAALLDEFLKNEQNLKAINAIIENQELLMDKWKLENRIADIIQQSVRILNGTVGKPYETRFNIDKFNWNDIGQFQFEGLDEIGLTYDEKTRQITGLPAKSGDYKIIFKFKIADEPNDAPYHEKTIPLIINPDPKALWKNIESDSNDPYWKEDNITLFVPLGDRQLLVSSKRGRAHANVGSFREDDFAYKDLASGWSVVVVADGAGSAKLSRKGSAIACNAVVEFFTGNSPDANMEEFEELLQQHQNKSGDDTQKKLNNYVYNKLGKAAFCVHKKLEEFAGETGVLLKD